MNGIIQFVRLCAWHLSFSVAFVGFARVLAVTHSFSWLCLSPQCELCIPGIDVLRIVVPISWGTRV